MVVFHRGFSLIELVACLLVIAIVAAVGVARFDQSSRRERAVSAARQVAAEIDRVRREADASSMTWRIAFESGSGKYTIMADDGSVTRESSVAMDPYLAEMQSILLGGDEELSFSGFGLPDSGGTITVRSSGWQVTITVNSSTGSSSLGRPVPVSRNPHAVDHRSIA